MKSSAVFLTLCCLILGVTFAYAMAQDPQEKSETKPAAKQEAKAEQADSELTFEPVDNMHHFMEYIALPRYRSLKKSLAGDPPANRKGWKPIKSDALILTETSALLAERVPEGATAEQAAQWRQLSHDVYTSGKAVYKSAGDFDAVKKNYGLMIDSCNKCHQSFADGKYQLKK